MAVTYRLPQAGGALQNPAYRLADVLQMRGSARQRRTPRQFRRQSFRDARSADPESRDSGFNASHRPGM